MIGLGILLSIIFKVFIFRNVEQHPYIYDLAITIALTIIIWEGNLRIDSYLNQKMPWVRAAHKRIFTQLIIAIPYSLLVLFIGMFGYHRIVCNGDAMILEQVRGSYLVSIFVTVSLLSIEIGFQFFKNWKASLLEVEKYKTESVNAQLQNLKHQVNPHFLFNNLSVLSSLVYKNQDKAVEFINELSKVYRYVLDNRNNELVLLSDELLFLNHYMYLLKIRFDENIVFTINEIEQSVIHYLPPMCLQMLVENAIKHNEVSIAKPLHVNIYRQSNTLVVENNLQPRSHVEDSFKTGLKNIQTRYAFFTDEKVEIIQTEKTFKVILPLVATT
jgi:two-component system, LytTR family, sensor kinase